jgi:hypothetical protein
LILSPARTNGKRAAVLMNDRAEFALAKRLRSREGVPLGEVFSFLSGLYFRGKFAYASHFGRPPRGVATGYVITSNRGLVDASQPIAFEELQAFGEIPIDPTERRYAEPLQQTAADLRGRLTRAQEVVLLGSIATDKYAAILSDVFGKRLKFPRDFIGRGDMSRGGLMLRAVRSNEEFEYVCLHEVESRRGRRPPKLLPPGRVE